MTNRRWLLLTQLLVALFVASLTAPRAQAQTQAALSEPSNFMSLTTFELSLPLGDTKKYVTGGLGPGLGWEGRWTVNAHSSAGVSLSVAGFSRHTDATIDFPSGAATGDQLRQLMPAQLLATGYVYPFQKNGVRWYAGGGVGGGHVDQDFTLGTTLRTQAERAARYERDIDSMLDARMDDGSSAVIGMLWWEYMDKWGERANWGLVSPRHNAYDGREAVRATGRDPWGIPTGGEDADYGDFLSAVVRANRAVADRLRCGGPVSPDRTGYSGSGSATKR